MIDTGTALQRRLDRYRSTIKSIPIVPQLERYGYRRVEVGPFIIYEPPARR